MTVTRRTLLGTGLIAGASLVARPVRAQSAPPPDPHAGHHGDAPAAPPASDPAASPHDPMGHHDHAAPAPAAPAAPDDAPIPPPRNPIGQRIVVPNGSVLLWTLRRGVKVFHLRAQPVRHQIAPGLDVEAWGYNGVTPGPVIEVFAGDRVRIYVTNELPEVTTIHWHGVLLPYGMDGVAGLTQEAIAPGKTFRYEFTFEHPGTYMYHPHADEMTQIALGMMGMIVVHPRAPEPRRVRDYALMSHEWKIEIGTRRANPLAMNDFNTLTFNGKSFPATAPLTAEVGDLVRIRLANLGPMDHHPIHIHGHTFELVATDGGPVPASARHPETTVLVPTGTTRTIEFVARAPGDWPLHCHMLHHAMNQMGHDAANLIGADTTGINLHKIVPGTMMMGQGGMSEMSHMRMQQPSNSISMVGGKGPHGIIEMGGMFTLVKVRTRLTGKDNADPGWYKSPDAEVSTEATADELARDGIAV
jgi:FtsP/CotA-like multicopper oxidase with cupredoxin domain